MDPSFRVRRLPRLCFWGVVVLTVIVAVCGTVALWTAFDPEIGYVNASPMTVICSIAAALAAAAAIIVPLFIPKGVLPSAHATGSLPSNVLFGSLPVIALCACAVFTLFTAGKALSTPSILGFVTALGAATYFLASIFPSAADRTWLLPSLGILPILWALLSIARAYTDHLVAMNSPIKLAVQFGCIGLALMMTAEIRFHLNKALPRLAFSLYGLAVLLCLGTGIPLTLAVSVQPDTRCHAVCLFAAGLYALKRLTDHAIPLTTVTVDGCEE